METDDLLVLLRIQGLFLIPTKYFHKVYWKTLQSSTQVHLGDKGTIKMQSNGYKDFKDFNENYLKKLE